MKILILGSVALPIPPKMQGGTERVAYYQAMGLSKKHQVTLIAAHGSKHSDSYRLIEIGGGDTVIGSQNVSSKFQVPSSNLGVEITETSRMMRKEASYLTKVSEFLLTQGSEYEVIINNMRLGESLFVPLAAKIGVPLINVTHLPLFKELADVYAQYKTPIVTISNAQRKPFPDLNYVGTTYNPVDVADFSLGSGRGNYLLMMGSITPHKNQAAAIRVAQKMGMKLIIAGKIGNQTYYEREIAPHIDGKDVVHVGEISLLEKNKLYGEAYAFLFPIVWEEPFGLVMIEAMATGTPVVAYGRGAIPEVVEEGKSGFVVGSEDEMVSALKKINQIDRAYCRSYVEKKFSVAQMVESLESILVHL